MKQPIFAPREIFEQILEYSVIPTFDLVVELPKGGIIVVKRKIAPYQNKWALPGLRMYKNETIEDTLTRIARQEVGLSVDIKSRKFLGQYVGKFTTEHSRQDLSTGYLVKAMTDDVHANSDHFSNIKVVKSRNEIPSPLGAMYAFYLEQYFEQRYL